MKWKNEFSVGIYEIDEQHRILADCVTSVEQAVVGRQRWMAVHSALIRAADFARIHFAVEESLMRIHDYPGLEDHIVEHRRFSEQLNALQHNSLTADVSEEMITFIRGWLELHVPAQDKPYAAYFLTGWRDASRLDLPQLTLSSLHGRPLSPDFENGS